MRGRRRRRGQRARPTELPSTLFTPRAGAPPDKRASYSVLRSSAGAMRPLTGRTPAVCLLLWACAGWGASSPPGAAPAAQHVARAEELANKGDLEAAARELQQAIELDPKSATTRVALGEVLQAQGKAEEPVRA